jgi:hypothetical protein
VFLGTSHFGDVEFLVILRCGFPVETPKSFVVSLGVQPQGRGISSQERMGGRTQCPQFFELGNQSPRTWFY